MKRTVYTLLAIASLLPFGCRKDPETKVQEDKLLTHRTADYAGVRAQEWVTLSTQFIQENNVCSPQAARIYGYVGLTLWESVYNGIPGARSLAGQINDYKAAPPVDGSKEYDWGIVLSTAMAIVLPAVMEAPTAAQLDRIEVLGIVQEAQSMGAGISPDVRTDSRDLGVIIAARIVQRAQNDGRNLLRNIVQVMPVRDAAHKWYWEPETPTQKPIEPLWSTVRTFVLHNAQSCEADAPFPYAETAGTAFYQDGREVYMAERSAANRSIAYHWEDGMTRTAGPAGHWMGITTQLLQNKKSNLAACAKAYCLAGCTMADAFSVAWYLKYTYNQLSPVTYLREQFDPNWKSLVDSPCFPDYTSEAATVGGAVPLVLTPLLGDTAFVDKTQLGSALYTSDGGPFVLPERTFTSLHHAGEEEAMSGIVAGTHFRRACERGLQSGRCVGSTVQAQLNFGF